jgi:hypothetical protein
MESADMPDSINERLSFNGGPRSLYLELSLS